MGSLGEWCRLAFSPSVVRRGLAYAVVVGAILIAINHGDAIVAGAIDGPRLWRMALTLLVPYLVSTTSSVAALRERQRSETLPDRTVRSGEPHAGTTGGGGTHNGGVIG